MANTKLEFKDGVKATEIQAADTNGVKIKKSDGSTIVDVKNTGAITLGFENTSNFDEISKINGQWLINIQDKYTRKFGKLIGRSTVDVTTNLLTSTPTGANCRLFVKVTVKVVSAVSYLANEHYGYAMLENSTGVAPAAMTTVSGSVLGGYTNVGSLSWSGTTLRYTTNTGGSNYLVHSVEIETIAQDGHNVVY